MGVVEMLNDYPDILTVAEIAETLYIGKNRVYELIPQLTTFRKKCLMRQFGI